MAVSTMRELDLETVKRIAAYDADSGEVLFVHEFMREAGDYTGEGGTEDAEMVRRAAAREFDTRNVKVLTLPRDLDLKPGEALRVDPTSGALTTSAPSRMSFRDFMKRQSGE